MGYNSAFKGLIFVCYELESKTVLFAHSDKHNISVLRHALSPDSINDINSICLSILCAACGNKPTDYVA